VPVVLVEKRRPVAPDAGPVEALDTATIVTDDEKELLARGLT
jgi:hypothetical protein